MIIKKNSFPAALCLVFALMAISSFFFDATFTLPAVSFKFFFPFTDFSQNLIANILRLLLLLAPVSAIISFFSVKRSVAAALIPLCIFCIGWLYRLGYCLAARKPFTHELIYIVFTMIVILLLSLFGGNKKAPAVVFLTAAAAVCLGFTLALIFYIHWGSNVLYINACLFFTLLSCLCLVLAGEKTEEPEETEELPLPEMPAPADIKANDVTLSQMLNELTNRFENGEIDEATYEAAKKEIIWKI